MLMLPKCVICENRNEWCSAWQILVSVTQWQNSWFMSLNGVVRDVLECSANFIFPFAIYSGFIRRAIHHSCEALSCDVCVSFMLMSDRWPLPVLRWKCYKGWSGPTAFTHSTCALSISLMFVNWRLIVFDRTMYRQVSFLLNTHRSIKACTVQHM